MCALGWVKCRGQIPSMGHHTWPHTTSLSLSPFLKTARCAITLGNCLFICLFTVQADLLCMYGTRPRSGPPVHAFGSINTSSPRLCCPCARPDCTCGMYNTGFIVQLTKLTHTMINYTINLLFTLCKLFRHYYKKICKRVELCNTHGNKNLFRADSV